MIIYTIGFTQKNAELFFETIKKNSVQLLVDVRLNNKSQLAGFTKAGDIEYFLKTICGTEYYHGDEFAPTKELLKAYQNKEKSWEEYETEFNEILTGRNVCKRFVQRFNKYDRICLLCSEQKPDQCHRRLVAEMIKKESEDEVGIIHL